MIIHQKVSLAIYMRYSSDNQRQDSIVDQRRNITEYLDRLGIDYTDMIELSDEAISGTITKRPGFQKLIAMIEREEVNLVVIDDLSRLTRGNDLGLLWDKMAFHGCRLISVLDGVDSYREGDETNAMIKGVMNNQSNKLHGKRVRRGIAGRALTKFGAAGNRCFGYASRYSDPEAALSYAGSGPKPKKEVYINEEEACIVREVFKQFTEENRTNREIAQWLNDNKIPRGRRARSSSGWTKQRVLDMLDQRKYVGIWRWGEQICRKAADGKVVKRPADPHDIIEVYNPDLAIISRETWDKAQELLGVLKERWGFKFGQDKRGPKRHYTEDSPNGPIGGLPHCGVCGRRMYRNPRTKRNTGPYYYCPNARVNGKGKDGITCTNHLYVREDRIVEALSDHLEKHLRTSDDWVKNVTIEAKKACAVYNAAVPDELKRLRDRLKEITTAIANITGEIERGGGKGIPGTLIERIQTLEVEKNGIEPKIRRLEAAAAKETSFLSDDFIKAQLTELPGVLSENPEKTAKLFRQIFGKVFVHSVVAPGKTRGHSFISFTPNYTRLVIHVANLEESPELNDLALQGENGEQVTIELPGHDKVDKLIHVIDSMRQEGRTWKSICAELGLATAYISIYYRKWKKLTEAERAV